MLGGGRSGGPNPRCWVIALREISELLDLRVDEVAALWSGRGLRGRSWILEDWITATSRVPESHHRTYFRPPSVHS